MVVLAFLVAAGPTLAEAVLKRFEQSVQSRFSRVMVVLAFIAAFSMIGGSQPTLAYWIYPVTTYKDGNATKNVWYTNSVTNSRVKQTLDVSSFYTQFGTVTVHISLSSGSSVSAQSSIVWNHAEATVSSKCKYSGEAAGPIPIACRYTRQLWVT